MVFSGSLLVFGGSKDISWNVQKSVQPVMIGIPLWEKHIPYQGTFEDDVPFSSGGICWFPGG